MERIIIYGQSIEEIFEEMLASNFYAVRLSFSMLFRLSQDKAMEVRMAVAEHPKTTAALLEAMSFDKEWRVRWAVAYNDKTPISTLKRLCQDEKWRVRISAERSLQEREIRGVSHKILLFISILLLFFFAVAMILALKTIQVYIL